MQALWSCPNKREGYNNGTLLWDECKIKKEDSTQNAQKYTICFQEVVPGADTALLSRLHPSNLSRPPAIQENSIMLMKVSFVILLFQNNLGFGIFFTSFCHVCITPLPRLRSLLHLHIYHSTTNFPLFTIRQTSWTNITQDTQDKSWYIKQIDKPFFSNSYSTHVLTSSNWNSPLLFVPLSREGTQPSNT